MPQHMSDARVHTVPCKACGHPVIFAQDTEGKIQCLDATAPTYGHIGETSTGQWTVRRMLGGFVSHFCTCPNVEKIKHMQAEKKGVVA